VPFFASNYFLYIDGLCTFRARATHFTAQRAVWQETVCGAVNFIASGKTGVHQNARSIGKLSLVAEMQHVVADQVAHFFLKSFEDEFGAVQATGREVRVGNDHFDLVSLAVEL
jgi:hypothetical protein